MKLAKITYKKDQACYLIDFTQIKKINQTQKQNKKEIVVLMPPYFI